MKTTRRKAIIAAALAPLALDDELLLAAEDQQQPSVELLGSWHVTSATNSVILSIEQSGKALVILMQSGSFGMGRTNWKALPGGILVDSYPRFRLWAGSDPNSLRAEIEDIPKDVEVSDDGWRSFPPFFLHEAHCRC